jgi:urease accessory protein
MSTKRTLISSASLAVLLLPALAQAHPGHTGDVALIAGLAHPLTGFDHLLVMLAMGAWAAQLSGPQRHALPLLFLGMLVLGALQPALPVTAIEQGIAASVLVMGLLLAGAMRIPFALSCVLASSFALLHGMAHGLESPGAAMPLAYVAGFVTTSAVLQLAGAAIAIVLARCQRHHALRIAGAGMALCGLAFMT